MRLIIRLVAVVALALLSAPSWGQLRYFTLIDSDNNVATGCAISLSTAGTVTGIDRRLTATVSETATPQVTQLTLESCVGGSFGASTSLPGTPYPVGLNNGVDGTDVVEQAVPINAIAAAGATVRFYFAAQGPTSSDLLGSVNDPPIVIETPPNSPNPVGIPSLSNWGLLILVLLLFVVLIRQRSHFPTSTVSVLLLVGALVGIAWAAGFRLDGQVDDWQGVSAVGTDVVGDSSPKTDITQAFVAQEGGTLFSRLDITNIDGSPPPNRPPIFTSTPVTTANIASPYSYAITTSDPDNNVLILTTPTVPAWLTFTPGGNGTGTLSGTPGITHFGDHAVVLRVIDSGVPSLSTEQSFTITVNGAIHPEPILDLNGAAAGLDFAATFIEDGSAVAIVDPANLTVTDPDSLNLASATITLTNLLDTGQETLAVGAAMVAPNTPITAAYNPSTGVLTLTGSATLAQYQAALRTITYHNTAAALTVTPARAITFVVSDGSNTSAPATATVKLVSVNDAPSFTAANPPAVNEDSGAQTVNGWVTAFEPGPADEVTQTVLAYAVSNVSNTALFATPPTVDTSGVLHYTPAPNAFGTSTFEVRVRDDGGTANGGVDTSAAQTFTIMVNPVNDAPSFTASNPPAVNEDAGAQTVNGWATFNPGNPQESAQTVLAYTVSNVSNPSLFAVPPAVNASGALSYTSAPNAFGTSTFEVRVQDDGGTANGGVDTSASQSFTITVTAVDDPPTAVNDSATVTEDDPATAIDVLTNDTDLDGGPKSIVSVTQPTNGTVAITGGGAGLTYQPNADYCNAPPGSVLDTFGYTLTPGGSSATVTVTVTCVNDAPIVDLNGPASGIDFAATFTEGGGAVAIVDPAELTVSDVDNPTLASATVTIGNLLDTGMETLAATVTGTSITANYVAPTLTLTGPDSLANFQQVLRGVTYNNGSSNPNATARGITFTVDDGAAASAVATSTVTIISINSAPSFTKGADQTVNEDSGAHTVNGWATSIDDGDGNTGGQILTFQVTNNTNPTLFSAGPAISPAGVLTYTPAADANGSATITVVLKDDGGTANGGVDTSVSQSFVINVTAVNDAPSFTKGADQTVLEDAGAQTVNPWATGISAGPANEAGQTLTFNITGNTNPGLFSAGPAISSAGVLTYTPAANANGSATITVTLSDNGGTANGGVDTSASQSFTITVTAVNDAPSFAAGGNQTVNEDAGAQTVVGWATGISAGPNEAGQTLSFIITGNTNPSLFSAGPAVASNGTLTYTPAPNQNGNATITLVLMDNGGTANGGVDTSASQNFAITVNAVNDPPVATAKNYTAMANMPIDISVGTGLIIGTTDVDNGINGCVSTSFAVSSVSATNPAGGSVVANPDGSFRFNPPPGVTGDVTFTYTVNDTGCPGPAATSAPATVTFNLSGPVIWFVDGTSGGNGTLASPFTSFSSAVTAMGTNTNQRIFIANANNQGGGTGVTLPTDGWLVGQGVAGASFDAVMGISPPAGTITRPAIGLGRPTIQGTVNMNGFNNHVMGLNISTNAAKGLARSNAGTINGLVVSDVGSITAVNSRAVDLSGVGIAFTATAINSSGSDVGINLVNQAGSFTVTGTGTAGSGGTVQNIANRGASFISANNITLQNMNFTNTAITAGAPCGSAAVVGANTGCNAAIHLDTVSTVTLNNLNLTISGQQGINGINVTNFNLSNSALSSLGNAPDEDGLHFHNMLGTNAITNTTIASSGDDNVNIQNLSSTASTITITGGGFNTGVLGSGLLFGSRNTADTTLNISGVTVDNNFSGGIVADGFDTARLKLKVTGSTITNNNDGIQVSANNGISQFDIDNNTLMGNDFLAITLLKAAFSTGGTLEGAVRNNNPITIANGRTTDAILIFQAGAGALKVAVTNNVINYAGTQRAILLQGGQDGNGSIDATLTGNNFDIQLDGSGNAVAGILAQTAITGPGNTTSLCADIGGTGALKNTFTHSLGGFMAGGDIRVRQRNDGTVRLPGYGGAATDTAAVATYLNGRNTVVSLSTATFDSTGFAGGGACTQPTLP